MIRMFSSCFFGTTGFRMHVFVGLSLHSLRVTSEERRDYIHRFFVCISPVMCELLCTPRPFQIFFLEKLACVTSHFKDELNGESYVRCFEGIQNLKFGKFPMAFFSLKVRERAFAHGQRGVTETACDILRRSSWICGPLISMLELFPTLPESSFKSDLSLVHSSIVFQALSDDGYVLCHFLTI